MWGLNVVMGPLANKNGPFFGQLVKNEDHSYAWENSFEKYSIPCFLLGIFYSLFNSTFDSMFCFIFYSKMCGLLLGRDHLWQAGLLLLGREHFRQAGLLLRSKILPPADLLLWNDHLG